MEQLGPQVGARTVVQRDAFAFAQREELLAAHAEQVAEGAGVAAEPDVIVLVDDAAPVGDQSVPPSWTNWRDARGGLGAGQVERRARSASE